MKFLLALIAVLAVAPIATAKGSPIWFVFLVKGDHSAPADKAQAMQDAHIANFKRLFAEHKLLAAGPLQDTTEFRRGIVVLRVPSQEAVRQCFNTDPYVQAGVMHLEVYRWEANTKGFNVKHIDPNAIEENRIALLLGPEHPNTKTKWPKVARKASGQVSGESFGPGEVKEIRLFAGTSDEAKIKSEMDSDPAIKKGKVRYSLMPLWMAKGTLKAR
jgi:uncharacterized protein YciI